MFTIHNNTLKFYRYKLLITRVKFSIVNDEFCSAFTFSVLFRLCTEALTASHHLSSSEKPLTKEQLPRSLISSTMACSSHTQGKPLAWASRRTMPSPSLVEVHTKTSIADKRSGTSVLEPVRMTLSSR